MDTYIESVVKIISWLKELIGCLYKSEFVGPCTVSRLVRIVFKRFIQC